MTLDRFTVKTPSRNIMQNLFKQVHFSNHFSEGSVFPAHYGLAMDLGKRGLSLTYQSHWRAVLYNSRAIGQRFAFVRTMLGRRE